MGRANSGPVCSHSGYRAGKAPRRVIEAKFRKEIQDELTKKLVAKSYQEAIAEKQLRVVSLTNLEEVEFGQDRSMRFRATVVTAPEFELPDYTSIPVQLPDVKVNEADVDATVERLREQAADFIDVPDRGLQMGDFAVLDFEGTIEGKAIRELAPEASKNLHGGKKFWIHFTPQNFLPDFCEQLIGQKRTETSVLKVKFPETRLGDGGEDGGILCHRERNQGKNLPGIDDAFAAKIAAGKTLAELRHMLELASNTKGTEVERAKEAQIVKFLRTDGI
jgi:trigger factor